jgi:hypothetical protein
MSVLLGGQLPAEASLATWHRYDGIRTCAVTPPGATSAVIETEVLMCGLVN